jgi:excisionase family DNA binding protein
MNELLGIVELQDLLKVSRRAVIRWRDNGTLPPALKIGRLVRWRRGDVEAWIENGCVPDRLTQGPGRRARS